MHYKVWLSILLVISLSTGCSLPFAGFGKNKGDKGHTDTLGMTPDFSYEIEEQLPNILVNQVGYSQEDSKTAILQGENLEHIFYVYEVSKEEAVYTGSLEAGNIRTEEESKTDIYLADFSDVKAPGTYYLYHPNLGYSYEFSISYNSREKLERDLLALLEKEHHSTALLCYQTAGILMTKELYSANLLEAERLEQLCQNNIALLLQAQDPVSGSVYADWTKALEMAEVEETQKQQYISLAATAEFAGVLAMYAHSVEKIDWNLAYQCRQAAERAYQSIQTSLDNVGYDAGYFAVAQLYRLTGKIKYAQATGQYLTMAEEQKSYTEYDFSLFGDLAYLSLTAGANLEWSELVMKKIMKQAEQISQTGGKYNYFISSERESQDINEILKDGSVLALVNYIITNHEYTTLQKNYVDYILGRNPEHICFMDGYGIRNLSEDKGIQEKNAALFYLLLQAAKV